MRNNRLSFTLSLICSLFGIVSFGAPESLDITEGKKALPMSGESFKVNGRDAFLILPEKASKNTPWVWYAPTLSGLPASTEVWMFNKFLAQGIAIAGIDVGESFGSPDGRKGFSDLYQYLTTQRGLGPKPCLLARSRGGLMLYNWAVENPEKVSGIAGIYPVCNIASYPGIERACAAYNMTSAELEKNLDANNPISRLKPLAEKRVPLFHIHGDIDKPVPYEENTKILMENYKKLGGPCDLELAAGQGHNMWNGFFQSETLTAFAIHRALGKPYKE